MVNNRTGLANLTGHTVKLVSASAIQGPLFGGHR